MPSPRKPAKRQPGLKLYVDAAEELGIDRNTVADLVRALGITPKATGMPGRTRGLDADDMKRLRRAIEAGKQPA